MRSGKCGWYFAIGRHIGRIGRNALRLLFPNAGGVATAPTKSIFDVVDLYAGVVESTTNNGGESSVEVVGRQIVDVHSDDVIFGFGTAAAHLATVV